MTTSYADYILKIETDLNRKVIIIKHLPDFIIVTLFADQSGKTQLAQEFFFRELPVPSDKST